MDRFREMQELIRSKVEPSGDLALAQAEEEKRRATEARRTEGSGMYGNPN